MGWFFLFIAELLPVSWIPESTNEGPLDFSGLRPERPATFVHMTTHHSSSQVGLLKRFLSLLLGALGGLLLDRTTKE
jgi:hypothetical protein